MKSSILIVTIITFCVFFFSLVDAKEKNQWLRELITKKYHQISISASDNDPNAIATPAPPYPLKTQLPNVTPPSSIDCPLKILASQFASYLQPQDWPFSNISWQTEVNEALQLKTLCNVTSMEQIPAPPLKQRVSTVPRERIEAPRCSQSSKEYCSWLAYVDATKGSDKNNGTIDFPFQSITYAVRQSRTRDITMQYCGCIWIREGTYYFGSTHYTKSSVGAIALTSIDSGLTISSYQNEKVILSGGIPLTNLSWKPYRGKILQTQIAQSNLNTEWSAFNELYYENWRGIRAKYPNGDPFLFGYFTTPTGYFNGASSWIAPPKPLPNATEIHVSQPEPISNYFPQFQIGIRGTSDVFNPPHSYWALANPPGGGGATYRQPIGLVANSELQGRMKNWSNPKTGLMFAYHCDKWGSDQYSIQDVDLANNTIMLLRGGFQEARGCDSASDQYFHNLIEELDDDNEYFFDRNTSTLYYQPNASQPFPSQFIASQLPCILSIHGSPSYPAEDITISGLTFTQTSNHFMSDYETPSGGDYTIHRGGSIFMTGAANVTIMGNIFYQLGGNAIVVSNWNQNNTIFSNYFRYIGESGIVLVGVADGIDGVSNLNQPNFTHVESNLFHDFCVYVKQGDAIFEAVVRNSVWAGNVAFNAPRSIVNKNDGFAGGLDMYQNLLFNANRETSDHGPFNSWDRQPYLTENAGNGPSLLHKTNRIHNNFLINDYGSDFSIDHDDGSAYYHDSYNLMMYSASKDLMGHTITNDHQLFAFSDLHGGYGFSGCQWESGHPYGSEWTNNQCILYNYSTPYSLDFCNPKNNTNIPIMFNNSFYVPNNQIDFNCGSDKDLSLQQWQQISDQDGNSTLYATPDVHTVVGWAKTYLFLSNGYSVANED